MEEPVDELRRSISGLIDDMCALGALIDYPGNELKRIFREVHPGKAQPKYMKPNSRTTWGLLFGFGPSARSYFSPNQKDTHKIQQDHIEVIALVLGKLKVFGEDAPPTGNTVQDWLKFIGHVRTLVKRKAIEADAAEKRKEMDKPDFGSHPALLNTNETVSEKLPTLDRDLHFIGDTDVAGIEWFLRNYKGAEYVYNTVFARSERRFYVKRWIRKLRKAIKRLLSAGCEWNDIVIAKEWPGILEQYDDMSPSQRKLYDARLLRTLAPPARLDQMTAKQKKSYYARLKREALPLIQCLVMNKGKDRFLALVGWSFPGSEKSLVYYSTDTEVCRYFESYCQKLFDDHCDEALPNRGRKNRTSRRKTRKANTAA